MNIITKLKDRILRHTILVRKRKMFYINENNVVIEPESCFSNMTHREWFSNININLNKTIRGYYNDGLIMIYTGLDHDVKELPAVSVVLSVYEYFIKNKCKVNKIGLGSYHSRWRTFIGKDWKPRYIVNMEDIARAFLEGNKNKVWVKKENILGIMSVLTS